MTDSHAKEHPLDAVRLQKRMADAGLCSRREGERWIAEGRVKVNGVVVTEQGCKVTPKDRVEVNGVALEPERVTPLLLALHKPQGVLCTRHDPEQRRTVYDLLGEGVPRLNSVGRLDYNSEGLLLFTNDGELANRLTHPSRQVPRTYKAKVHGKLPSDLVERLSTVGIPLEDGPTGPVEITLDHAGERICWFTLTLREGRNRMVRRIFEAFGLEVARLIRIAYGGVELGDLPAGGWRPLTREEVMLLRQAAGFNPRGEGRFPKLRPSTPKEDSPRQERDKRFRGKGHGPA